MLAAPPAAATAQSVGADDDAYQLSYSGGPGCPSEVAVRNEVASRVADPKLGRGARIALAVEGTGGRVSGVLRATSAIQEEGRREIQGRSCAEVTRALIFLATLAIDMGGRIEPDTALPIQPTPPTPPTPLTPPETLVLSARLPAPVLQKSAQWALSLDLGAHGGLSDQPFSPAAALGIDRESTAQKGWAPAGQAALSVASGHLSRPEGQAAVWLVAGRLRLSPVRFRAGPVVVKPGVGVEAGVVFARGAAIEDARQAIRPWLAVEATLGLRVPLGGRWFIEGSGGLSAPLISTRYFFQPAVALYTTPALTYLASAGVGRVW